MLLLNRGGGIPWGQNETLSAFVEKRGGQNTARGPKTLARGGKRKGVKNGTARGGSNPANTERSGKRGNRTLKSRSSWERKKGGTPNAPGGPGGSSQKEAGGSGKASENGGARGKRKVEQKSRENHRKKHCNGLIGGRKRSREWVWGKRKSLKQNRQLGKTRFCWGGGGEWGGKQKRKAAGTGGKTDEKKKQKNGAGALEKKGGGKHVGEVSRRHNCAEGG